jgi:hypothetical protein
MIPESGTKTNMTKAREKITPVRMLTLTDCFWKMSQKTSSMRLPGFQIKKTITPTRKTISPRRPPSEYFFTGIAFPPPPGIVLPLDVDVKPGVNQF